ncbi:MAG TPA: hypothetical protein VJ782_11615 [Aeromicrobium sp.]|nr:hypothetical protein [Aeromicrobium sp.]
MFVGHYSVSLVARRSTVDLPLWIWFVAVQWLDFGFMVLVLLGIEKVRIIPGFTESNPLDLYYMPYTHGLLGATVMSAIFAALVAVAFPAARSAGGLGLLWLASFSHWLLDLVMHTPDLPIVAGPTKVGLGLWNHLAIGLALEILLLVLAAWFYARSAGPQVRVRAWILVGAMVLLQVYSNFGPTPGSTAQFAVTALAAYGLLTAGAYWVERTRGT